MPAERKDGSVVAGKRKIRAARFGAASIAAALVLAAAFNAAAFAADSGGKPAADPGPTGAATSGAASGRCQNSVGPDDTIGGRTGPPGSPMINSGTTNTPDIATNPPCGPK